MRAFSLRSLTVMLLVAFLVWSCQTHTCNARMSKHRKQSKGALESLYKREGNNHGSSHQQTNAGKSKNKVESPKAPVPPETKPKKDGVTTTPKKDYSGLSTVFNVIDFGATGDGTRDDTKVPPNSSFLFTY